MSRAFGRFGRRVELSGPAKAEYIEGQEGREGQERPDAGIIPRLPHPTFGTSRS